MPQKYVETHQCHNQPMEAQSHVYEQSDNILFIEVTLAFKSSLQQKYTVAPQQTNDKNYIKLQTT